jgi:hypothetical protein
MDDVESKPGQTLSLVDEELGSDESRVSGEPKPGDPKLAAWLSELGSLVQQLAILLRRERTAMARRDLRALGQLLSQQELLVARLNHMATSPEGERALGPVHSGEPTVNPEVAGLYRRLLGDLVDLAASNRANEQFLVTARRAIQGAMYWHSGPEGEKRLTSYTRQGRLAV